MKAIIFHSNSNKKRSEHVAFTIDGDHFGIKPLKTYKSIFMQMFMYGYKTTFKKRIEYHPVEIDFDKYDQVVLVSPVWAGKVNAVMRSFLLDHQFHGKKVTLIGTSDGENKKYFESYKGLIDSHCEIIGKELYIKGVKK